MKVSTLTRHVAGNQNRFRGLLHLVGSELLARRIEEMSNTAEQIKAKEQSKAQQWCVKAELATDDSNTICKAVITDQDGRVLILKDAGSDYHDLPGGHIKVGETPIDGLTREVKEETGLSIINVEEMEGQSVTLPEGKGDVRFFTAQAVDGKVKLSDEHEGFEWVKSFSISRQNLGHFMPPVLAAMKTDGVFKPPNTANHKHAATVVLRTARLQSVANWLVKQDTKELDKLQKRLAADIRKSNPAGAGSPTQQDARLAALFAITDKDIADTFSGMAADAAARQDQLAGHIHETNKVRVKRHFNVDVKGEPDDAKRVLVWGAPLREHYEYLGNKLAFLFRTMVRQGVAKGEAADAIVGRMDGTNEAVKASEGVGHEFHGNQWTVETVIDDKNEKVFAIKGVHSVNYTAPAVKDKLPENTSAYLHALKNKSGVWHVSHVEVAEQHRRQGMATALYNKAESSLGEFKQHVYVTDEGAAFGKARYNVKASVTQDTVRGTDRPHKPVQGGATPSPATNLVTAAGEAIAKQPMTVGVQLFDGTENSLAKVIESAVQALSHMVDVGGMGGDEDDDEDEEKNMGWIWTAVMDDGKTCPFCENLDGQKWDAEFNPANDETDEYPGDPPIHSFCRCVTLPINLDDENPGEVVLPNGKKEPISFEDYLSQYSGKEQEETFGKQALSAYRRGDLTANQLIGQRSNLLSLERFKEMEQ